MFSSPYAVRTLKPDCYRAKDLGFPLKGYVYCYPGQANYLGGDILSGMAATEIYKQEEISVFLDIGTNGELVIGNKDFLGAGARRGCRAGSGRRCGKNRYAGRNGSCRQFLHLMVAAEAIPHTDIRRYPTVEKELKKRGLL